MFISNIAKKFWSLFIKQITKLDKVMKAKKKKQKLYFFNYLYFLSNLNFKIFLIKIE